MSELRDRFRALDALDVPDVLSRARMMGPKPPEPDPTPPMRRVGALVFAAIVVIVAVVLVIRALDQPARPADPTPTPPAFRQDGEVITHSGDDAYAEGDLVAVNPETGGMRTIVAAGALGTPEQWAAGSAATISDAAWSPDGRWVAFEIHGCDGDSTDGGKPVAPYDPPRSGHGLWVTNGVDKPRQLMARPCSEDPEVFLYDEHWEWSPTGAQLAFARRSIDGDALILIDPQTGDRTDLGEAAGDVTSLAWSPDGTRIAYGVVPTGTSGDYSAAEQGSLHSVEVDGGEHALLASSVGLVSGGKPDQGSGGRPTVRASRSRPRVAKTAEIGCT